MKIKRYLAVITALFTLNALTALADNVAIHTDANFQVLGLSPNGEWACGVFVDAGNNTYPFRWNLLTDRVEILGTKSGGTAWDVANDGTVSGDYYDTEVAANHAPILMPCYWQGTVRHAVEMPAGKLSDGFGGGISADGHYMVGTIENNGIYTSYIWRDGKLVRDLKTGEHNVASCVSPDGLSAAGWSMKYNRTACLWSDDSKPIYFEDGPHPYGPFNYARNFSPDGKKLLYWGGWEYDESDETLYLYCIYDIESGQQKKIKAASGINSEMEFFDISNNELLVGEDGGRGCIYADGRAMYIDDYLTAKGVDIKKLCGDMYSGTDYYVGQLPIFRVVAVSEDEKVLAMQYYNTKGEVSSMVLKMGQDFSTAKPVEVAARQLEGLNTVALTWHKPAGMSSGVSGYYISRDGKALNRQPVTNLHYYDAAATPGEHTYKIALATTANKLNYSDEVKVTVAAAPAAAPYALFARQKGVNGAFVAWQAPFSDIAHKRYFDVEADNAADFAIYESLTVEAAIRFDKDEVAQYKGCKVSEVSFIPLAAHDGWALNLYTRDNSKQLQRIYTQPINQQLNIGSLNTVVLDQPQALPTGELIVAIQVQTDGESTKLIGAQTGRITPGYGDLLRRIADDDDEAGQEDYISIYDNSIETGYSLACMTWAIDLGLQPAEGESAQLRHYNVYVDDSSEAIVTTTNSCSLAALSDGAHKVAVEAVYADARTSLLIDRQFDVKAAYPAVNDVEVKVDGGRFTASWLAPEDKDLTQIAYTSAKKHGTGVYGYESQNYAFLAASEYTPDMLRGYDGYRITAFRFYPMSDALFTLFIYENGKLVYEQEIDQELAYNQWNTVLLDRPLTVNESASYILGVDVFDPEPGVGVLALDSYVTFENRSDLISLDGGLTWMSLSVDGNTNGIGNWMMGMQIEADEAQSLAIDGYDVYVDGRKGNANMLTATTYTAPVATGRHTLRVSTHYPGHDTAVEGDPTSFNVDTDAVTDIPTVTPDSPRYTLQGIRAGRDYRGIVVERRKLINK